MLPNRFFKLFLMAVVVAVLAFIILNNVASASKAPIADPAFHTPPMSDYGPVDHSFHTPPMSDYEPVDYSFHTPPMSDYKP